MATFAEASRESQLRSLANESNVPFRLAVEALVRKSSKWQIVSAEYAWTHPATGRTGFADTILEFAPQGIRLVTACRRAADKSRWIFFNATDSHRVHAQWTAVSADREASGVDELWFVPSSDESALVGGPGSSDEPAPVLEPLARGLLDATEAVAHDQMALDLLHRAGADPQYWFYVPVIITNAELVVCRFDPADVDFASGELPPQTQFTGAGCVRLFKNLARAAPDATHASLTDRSRAQDRTVVVVNVDFLPPLLDAFKLADRTPMPAAMRQVVFGT